MLGVVLSAIAFPNMQSSGQQQLAAGLFALCLGGALLFWGGDSQREGRVRGRRVYFYREQSPRMFWIMLCARNYLPGVIMLAAGLWYMLGPVDT